MAQYESIDLARILSSISLALSHSFCTWHTKIPHPHPDIRYAIFDRSRFEEEIRVLSLLFLSHSFLHSFIPFIRSPPPPDAMTSRTRSIASKKAAEQDESTTSSSSSNWQQEGSMYYLLPDNAVCCDEVHAFDLVRHADRADLSSLPHSLWSFACYRIAH